MSIAFGPGPENRIYLRLVKLHDQEVICDQDGRELDSVLGFRYERLALDDDAILTLKLSVEPARWNNKLGVKTQGEPVSLETTKIV